MSRFLVAILGSSILLGGLSSTAWAESAPLRLIVERGEARHELALGFENQSDGPVLVYIDVLLAQVELRGERRGLGLCRTPGDATPRQPDARRFVELAPGERAVEALDLRFTCWGQGLSRLDAAREARVTYRVRFGADRLGRRAWTGSLGPAQVALELDEPASEGDGEGDSPDGDGDDPAAQREPPILRLLRIGPAPDVAQGEAMTVSLELRARKNASVPVAVRHELFSFQVTTPSGRSHECSLGESRVRPLREFYERLGRSRVGLEMARLCPTEALDEAGIYELRPLFRAQFDGQDVGIDAWTGDVEGAAFLARVRRAGRNAYVHVEIKMPESATEGGEGDAR